jgi:MoaA/NifB/PqqE/SkfB family radical SAM enzyme
MDLGCRLAIFSEYVPVDNNDTLCALTTESKIALHNFCLHNSDKILLIAFPGDEEHFGGCLAAGRGVAHISASGNLEPCPFAAYSDSNVLKAPLLDALASPLLKKIRSESHLLHEGEGGCALRGREAAFM